MIIKSLKIFGIIIIGLSISVIIIHILNPELSENLSEFFFSKIVRVKCIDYKQGIFSRKLNNKIPDYIESSILRGIKKCKDEQEILERVSAGKLIEIQNGNSFIIGEMSHSYPYLTENGQELLTEIGKRFHDKISETRLRGSKIRITSLTRTTDKLRDLRQVNSNTSMNSPHLYGNAIDLSYIRFTTRKLFLTYCDKRYLKEALAEVIWQLREENRCWATYETKQNCFHVVAR
jgi:hypothetical protein